MFEVGDRVRSTEGLYLPDGIIVPRDVRGAVVEVLDAQEVYPHPPQYHPAYRGEKKETKFPAGTKVYRVLVDGETTPKGVRTLRNFHESQLSPE